MTPEEFLNFVSLAKATVMQCIPDNLYLKRCHDFGHERVTVLRKYVTFFLKTGSLKSRGHTEMKGDCRTSCKELAEISPTRLRVSNACYTVNQAI
jgi:hypothetical protein